MGNLAHSIRRRLKDRFPPRTIGVFRYARAKYVEIRFQVWLRRELRRSNLARGRLASTGRAVRSTVSRKTNVLFFPEHPTEHAVAFKLCIMLGYAITTDPDGHWDVAFKWQDTTFFDRALLDRLPREIRIINRESVDISKAAVDRAMQQVFGYSARIDPTQYIGQAVQKSDLNATHDGQIIHCPLPQASLISGCVYEKLIDNSVSTRAIYEIRVPVQGARIPLVFLKYRPTERRFGLRNSFVHVSEADDVFRKDELENILAFSRKIGLDVGELDVLRDRTDGRIYIIDANNTPWGPPKRLSPVLKQVVLARLAETFADLIQEVRRGDTAT